MADHIRIPNDREVHTLLGAMARSGNSDLLFVMSSAECRKLLKYIEELSEWKKR